MQHEPCDLRSCFLCSNCTPVWKELIAIKKTTLHIKKGGQVFREGEEVKGIYFMYSGAAKVHKQWTQEKELILRFTKAGDLLGHRPSPNSRIDTSNVPPPKSKTAILMSFPCLSNP